MGKLWIAGLIGLGLAGAAPAAEPGRKPNVVLVLADDLGYGDLGCYGAADLRTPHLDRLAAEGTRFTDFSVAAPLCTPSRAALLTGLYPGRVGLATGVLRPDAKTGLKADVVTLPRVLKSAGYATGCIGKWHLGFLPGMRPTDHGFDSYYGVMHNLDKFEVAPFEKEGGIPVLRGDAVEKRPAVPAEMTGLYTAEALRFIRANREKPFFLYVAHQMPHIPFDASARFKGKSKRGLYGDAVEELDDSVGQVVALVRELGLAESTLVLFTSDNGPERRTPGTAAPLRGTKHTCYEGGLRVPCLAWWPGRVPAGRVCDEFLATLDVLPTVAALTGSPLPAGAARDGFDASAVFLGKPGAHSPRTSLFALYGLNARRQESVREGRWKLHLGPSPELYDLKADPGEARNVAAEHPDVVARLTKRAGEIAKESGVAK